VNSKYFSEDEITCNCGCGNAYISEDLLNKLDGLRNYCGFPIYTNSIARCMKYNLEVGSSNSSSHVSEEDRECEAADLRMPDDAVDRYILLKGVLFFFNRIGISVKDDFIHVDVSEHKPPDVIWLYK
jgi:hypothetical protein